MVGEMPGSALWDRPKALVEADECDFDPTNLLIFTPDVQDGPMPDFALFERQEAIERIATAHGVELIIVDNISTLCRNTGSENDAESWRTPQERALRMRRAGRPVPLPLYRLKGDQDAQMFLRRGRVGCDA